MAGGRNYKGYVIRDGRPGRAAGRALQDNFKRSADHVADVTGNPHEVTAVMLGLDGLYLLRDHKELALIASGSFNDAKWLGKSIVATTTDGEVVRLDSHVGK